MSRTLHPLGGPGVAGFDVGDPEMSRSLASAMVNDARGGLLRGGVAAGSTGLKPSGSLHRPVGLPVGACGDAAGRSCWIEPHAKPMDRVCHGGPCDPLGTSPWISSASASRRVSQVGWGASEIAVRVRARPRHSAEVSSAPSCEPLCLSVGNGGSWPPARSYFCRRSSSRMFSSAEITSSRSTFDLENFS